MQRLAGLALALLARAERAEAVLGVVSANSSNSMRPAASPPMVISKYTRGSSPSNGGGGGGMSDLSSYSELMAENMRAPAFLFASFAAAIAFFSAMSARFTSLLALPSSVAYALLRSALASLKLPASRLPLPRR